MERPAWPMPRLPPNGSIPRLWRHHSRRPRKRSCDSMLCRSSCARSSPARPLLGLLVWSLSSRRSAASTRSRARCRSATVYCRGCCRVRFPRGPFDGLFAGMADLGCFIVAIWPEPQAASIQLIGSILMSGTHPQNSAGSLQPGRPGRSPSAAGNVSHSQPSQ